MSRRFRYNESSLFFVDSDLELRDDGTYSLGESMTDGAGSCGSTIARGRWTQDGDTIVLAKEAWRHGGKSEWTTSSESKTATIDGNDLLIDGNRWSRSH